MKRHVLSLDLVLAAVLLPGCAGFMESMAGSVAGNATYQFAKKHLTSPVSTIRNYELPAGRMKKELRAVLRARGFTAAEKPIEGKEPATELVAENPLGDQPLDPELTFVIESLSTSRSRVEVRVRSLRPGRSTEDDRKLSEEILEEVTRRVMWG